MASYRIREYGLKLVEGDLVLQGMNAKWWERRNNPTAERIRYVQRREQRTFVFLLLFFFFFFKSRLPYLVGKKGGGCVRRRGLLWDNFRLQFFFRRILLNIARS